MAKETDVGCIYMARNTVNGKCYIGKTVKAMKHRRAWHLATASRGDGWCFHNAIRKYGIEAFEWSILAGSDDYDELGQMEKDLIAKNNTKRPNGYNLTSGGDGVVGRTPEVMARIVAFHTGRKRSEETRRRQSAAAIGKQKRLGAVISDETKRKLSVALKGKRHTAESKEKIAQSLRGIPKPAEQRKKMSDTRKRWFARKAERNYCYSLLDIPEEIDA